jgi:hypothetical protein
MKLFRHLGLLLVLVGSASPSESGRIFFDVWLVTHPSPNSGCDPLNYAALADHEGSRAPSCDARLVGKV